MKEIIIKYKDTRILALLKDLAKYFDFSITPGKKIKNDKKDYTFINGIPVIPGDSSISINELNKIFTGKNLEAKKLRTEGWRRQK